MPGLAGCEEFETLLLELAVGGMVGSMFTLGSGGSRCGSILSKKASFSGERAGIKLCKEGAEFNGDRYCWEEEAMRRVNTSGGTVGGIACTRDVACVVSASSSLCEVVYSLEDFIGGLVTTAPFPPSFDDATVVPVNLVVKARCSVVYIKVSYPGGQPSFGHLGSFPVIIFLVKLSYRVSVMVITRVDKSCAFVANKDATRRATCNCTRPPA